jgi:hypothetical protein
MKSNAIVLGLVGALCFAGLAAQAQDSGLPPDDEPERTDPELPYSPYATGTAATRVYWGDTHLHTSFSMDAGAFGNRLGLEDAYRFARGEEVDSTTAGRVRLARPLDFLVVADHSDNMGFFPDLFGGTPELLEDPKGKEWYDKIQGGEGMEVALEIIDSFSRGTFPDNLMYWPDSAMYRSAWDKTVAAAEKFNEPGRFTAFIGYEWTSNTGGNNLHRVVIYRDGGGKASIMEPYTTLKPAGSDNPVDLWAWMQTYQERTGGRVLAIAHNGNLSNGIMFPVVDSFSGKRIDRAYAETRARWEPLYEATQIKGDGEAHPLLSPNDEFADYETWDKGNLDLSVAKDDNMLQYEYARTALQIGLQLDKRLGVNPYKFGMIGATDSHTGLATAGEDNFFGKHSGTEPNAERYNHPMAETSNGRYESWEMVASGLAGVWARDNTREALFDAMMRKETYATTGPRMLVRFFGGWNFDESDTRSRLPADQGYRKGVPMGADLPPQPQDARAPTFLVAARKDPMSGNLDRIQIVKGWLDNRGERREKVYDVVWSDAAERRPDGNGAIPPVGNTVDVAEATFSNTIGDPELIEVWTDPDFDPDLPAVYYARVIEIPTPRWTAYDAKRYGVTMPDKAKMITQERAYTSPIWYSPKK